MTSPDDIAASLDAYLDIDIPVAEPEGGFPDPDRPPLDAVVAPEDEDRAERILYKLARLAEERDAITAHAEAEWRRIDAWRADMVSGVDAEAKRAERSLELFMRNWHRDHPRSKTLRLIHGVLKLGKGRGKIIVQDEFLFTSWAEENGRADLLRYEPKIKKAELSNAEAIPRHEGVQINDPDHPDLLVQTYRLMVDVPLRDAAGNQMVDDNGELLTNRVSAPGVLYAEPVIDKFTATPTTKEQA